jgi:hypothetical protein
VSGVAAVVHPTQRRGGADARVRAPTGRTPTASRSVGSAARVLQLVLDGRHVEVGQPSGALGVALDDGVHDPAVVGVCALESARHPDHLVGVLLELRRDRLPHVQEERIAAGLRDLPVEAAVELHELALGDVGYGGRGDDRAQELGVVVGEPPCGELGGLALDRHAGLEQVAHRDAAEQRLVDPARCRPVGDDEDADPVGTAQEAGGLEGADRLAHRAAADAELLGEHLLVGQLAADLALPGDDEGLELPGDRVGELVADNHAVTGHEIRLPSGSA